MKKIKFCSLLFVLLPIMAWTQQISPEMIQHERERRIKSLKAELKKLKDDSYQRQTIPICMELANLTGDGYYLREVLHIDSLHLEANFNLAKKLNKQAPEKALEFVRRVLRQKKSAAAYQLLATIYFNLGEVVAYERALQNELKHANANSKFFPTEKLADLFLEKEMPQKAVQIYTDQFSNLSVYGKYQTHINRGSIYLEEFQDYPKTILECDAAIAIYPDHRATYQKKVVHLRGMAHWGNKQFDKAIEDWAFAERLGFQLSNRVLDRFYKQLVIDYPKVSGFYYVNALRLERQGSQSNDTALFLEAIEYLNLAIQLERKNALFFLCRARCKKGLKDYQAALDDLNQCIAIKPNFAAAFRDRGAIKYLLKLFAESELDYKNYKALRKLEQ